MDTTPTLWHLPVRASATIVGVDESLASFIKTRLSEMGIIQLSAVACLQNAPLGGPKVYQVRDSVFCLDKDLAEKIYIQINPSVKESTP